MSTIHTKIGGGGRIVIPAEYREQLGLKEGDTVTIALEEFGVRISNARLALLRMQRLAKERIEPGRSLSKELIAERRQEAAKE
jgi:AbrB family looped-hinge helix DNA binding protein